MLPVERFVYGPEHEALVVSIILRNSESLSRSRTGVLDTAVSSAKSIAPQIDLKELVRENEINAARDMFSAGRRLVALDGDRLYDYLLSIVRGVNQGIVPADRLFRSWSIPYHEVDIPPTEVPDRLREFCRWISASTELLRADPPIVAGEVEWQLNAGPLHPFYDGCGRVSRLFSAFLLVNNHCLLPLYESRASYFRAAQLGVAQFVPYVRSAIRKCRHAIETARR